MLRFDRFKRASARDCLGHTWLQGTIVQGEIEMMQRRERLLATHAHLNALGFRRESAAVLADALKPIDYFSLRASQAHITPYFPSPLSTTQVSVEPVNDEDDLSPGAPLSSHLPPLPEAAQEHSGITITGVSTTESDGTQSRQLSPAAPETSGFSTRTVAQRTMAHRSTSGGTPGTPKSMKTSHSSHE